VYHSDNKNLVRGGAIDHRVGEAVEKDAPRVVRYCRADRREGDDGCDRLLDFGVSRAPNPGCRSS
jgi:hypothetical protein